MLRFMKILALLCGVAAVLGGCATDEPIGRLGQVGYRNGTVEDDYTSNGERGNVTITEINWAGSVRGTIGLSVHDPDDIFIELQNRYSRPVHLTDWQISVQTGTGNPIVDEEIYPRSRVTYRIPLRENREPVQPNEYVVIAAKRDGAFPNADYYIEDLELPAGRFEITLLDIDDRLMEDGGDIAEEIFAGGYDLMTVRSMERVTLIFSNQGGRESSWHAYSLNFWDDEHTDLTQNIAEDYRTLTYASPGMPSSPDYSGNASSGSFE
ncbi:MAG: hypothetical protein KC561_09065 [Myxococcales bacterium]|nr:hypothetical protein [Myxococcales bacterium]